MVLVKIEWLLLTIEWFLKQTQSTVDVENWVLLDDNLIIAVESCCSWKLYIFYWLQIYCFKTNCSAGNFFNSLLFSFSNFSDGLLCSDGLLIVVAAANEKKILQINSQTGVRGVDLEIWIRITTRCELLQRH